MEKKGNQFKKLVKHAAEIMMDTDMYEWPPTCAILVYQPVRPVSAKCQDVYRTKSPQKKAKRDST